VFQQTLAELQKCLWSRSKDTVRIYKAGATRTSTKQGSSEAAISPLLHVDL